VGWSCGLCQPGRAPEHRTGVIQGRGSQRLPQQVGLAGQGRNHFKGPWGYQCSPSPCLLLPVTCMSCVPAHVDKRGTCHQCTSLHLLIFQIVSTPQQAGSPFCTRQVPATYKTHTCKCLCFNATHHSTHTCTCWSSGWYTTAAGQHTKAACWAVHHSRRAYLIQQVIASRRPPGGRHADGVMAMAPEVCIHAPASHHSWVLLWCVGLGATVGLLPLQDCRGSTAVQQRSIAGALQVCLTLCWAGFPVWLAVHVHMWCTCSRAYRLDPNADPVVVLL
jgi:hypothetical protein